MGGKRIGVEMSSWFITISDYERLKGMLPDAEWVDCSMMVEEGRMIKSPKEIEYITHAARATEAGVLAGVEASAVGATENEVAAAVHTAAQIKAGSEYTGLPLFVTAGKRSFLGHVTWYRETIQAGRHGLPGDIGVHKPVSRITDAERVSRATRRRRQIKATGVMATALEEMIKFIKPGVRAHDAHMVCKNVIAGCGPRGRAEPQGSVFDRPGIRSRLGRGPYSKHERGRVPGVEGGHDVPPDTGDIHTGPDVGGGERDSAGYGVGVRAHYGECGEEAVFEVGNPKGHGVTAPSTVSWVPA